MSFVETFNAHYHGTLSNEGIEYVTEADVAEVVDLREEPDHDPVNDYRDIKRYSTMVTGSIDMVNDMKDVHPADLDTVVPTVNRQLKATAETIGETDPVLLKIDPDSYELDQVSVEGAMSWLKNGLKAIGAGLRKAFDRLATGFHRMSNATIGLNRRISKCQSLLGRRKNPGGGNPVKLHKRYMERLVLGDGIITSYVEPLAEFSGTVKDIINIYRPVLESYSTDIRNRIWEEVSGNRPTEPGHDIGEATQTAIQSLQQRTSQVQLMGNLTPEVILPGSGKNDSRVPRVALKTGRPDPAYVARNLKEITSLSNEAVRDLLDVVQNAIGGNTTNNENVIDLIWEQVEGIHNAIMAIDMDENGQLNRLKYLVERVEQSLEIIFGDVWGLNQANINAIGAVIAIAEESLLQD